MTADEVTSRTDGSLFFLRAAAGKHAPLQTVAVFAAKTWTLVYPEGADVSPLPDPTPEPPRQPRLYPKIDTPDQIASKPW